MTRRRAILVLGVVPLAGCASVRDVVDEARGGVEAPVVVAAEPSPTPTRAATSTATTTTTTTTTTTVPSTTTPPVTAPPTSSPAINLVCTVTVQPGETLRAIADRYDDETIDLVSLVVENGLATTDVAPGTVLDICPGNGLDDVTGTERVAADAPVRTGVEAQQEHLNTLFAGSGIEPLTVDGISGPVTRQRLCAARLALGLPVSTADLEPGSEEERLLFATGELPVPYTSAVLSDRWILIDRTCQIMFVGRGPATIDFVFPTSTGQAAYPTRDQDRSEVFRYDPALHNNGWHNSTTYPAAGDNPLNGNMYKPLYFDGGQAIHGANNVPRSPASHGCARLRVQHQDALVAWLGLADVGGPTNDPARIGVTVNVQGTWRG